MTTQAANQMRKKKKKSILWNIMTILVLLATACLVLYVVAIFRNPVSPLNLLPPVATPTIFATDTPTITPIQQPATWTPTSTLPPSSTRTRAATWTLLPGFASETFTPEPSRTFTPENTIDSPVSVTITYHPATELYPDSSCNLLAIGGEIVDSQGNSLLFFPVELGGSLNGQVFSQLKLSGSATAYGASGFEFQVADHPIASTHTLYLQVYGDVEGVLTDKIYIDTFDDCARNLIRATFTVNE